MNCNSINSVQQEENTSKFKKYQFDNMCPAKTHYTTKEKNTAAQTTTDDNGDTRKKLQPFMMVKFTEASSSSVVLKKKKINVKCKFLSSF